MEEFRLWLPGELEYSAVKAGYDKKIERARLPQHDPRSMHGFLGEEWFQFQEKHKDGIDYLPFHAKSAQLQLAKVSAGLFDKAAICNWIISGEPAIESEFVHSARTVGSFIISTRPWVQAEPFDYMIPFHESPICDGIDTITKGIIQLIDEPINHEVGNHLFKLAIDLGARAAATYGLFAHEFLQDSQFLIPVSELAPK